MMMNFSPFTYVINCLSSLCHVLPRPFCQVAMPVVPESLLFLHPSTLPCRIYLVNIPVDTSKPLEVSAFSTVSK